jgi:hypothetical protein
MILGVTASSRVAAATSGPAFRSVATTTTTSSTMTCAMPAGFAAGDILVMQVNIGADAKTGSPGYNGSSPPPGWTTRSTVENYSGDLYLMDVFTKTATGSETSLTWTGGANWNAGTMSIMAISGATAFDVVGSPSGSLVASSVTTTTASDLLVGCWFNWSSSFYGLGTITKPASMTQRSNLNVFGAPNSIYLNSLMSTETLTASGATGTRTATVGNTMAYQAAVLLAVK